MVPRPGGNCLGCRGLYPKALIQAVVVKVLLNHGFQRRGNFSVIHDHARTGSAFVQGIALDLNPADPRVPVKPLTFAQVMG